MANTLQAKKRIRRNANRTDINKMRVTRIRSNVRSVEEAITAGDQSVAADALKTAQPQIMRGVTKGVLHAKTASRKISRLAQRINGMG